MIDEHRMQQLLDKQAIYELMCRYCRGVDRMDKELTLSCFWPGAIDIHVGAHGMYRGSVEEFLDAEWESWKVFTASQHHLCNHLCEVDGDQALAETYQFSLYWKEPGDDPKHNWLNSNRYIDRFERQNGEWRIIHRELYRNFSVIIQPVNFPSAANGWPMPSQDRNDPAYRTLKKFTVQGRSNNRQESNETVKPLTN
ncbi:MAG: nuclear transport factor 2 family protein [Rhodopila sp.]|jgi:hypothetical protein